MKNRGNITLSVLMTVSILFVLIIFIAIMLFQNVTVGEFHNIKNDMYLINRNVLLAIQRDAMGEDEYVFYERDVEKLVEEEIKRLWNVDVSRDTEKGAIKKVDVESVEILNYPDKIYIKTKLRIKLRPIVFTDILENKLMFEACEVSKAEKMRN